MKASGLRAADIARICDVRRQTVGKWLQMDEARLEARYAACIAAATGTDLMRLIAGDSTMRRRRKYSGRRALLSVRFREKFPVRMRA